MKNRSFLQIFIVASMLLLLNGCVAPTEKMLNEVLFYPPEPEIPRFQYLTSISSSEDIEGRGDGFSKFILGEEGTNKLIVKPYGVTVKNGKIYVSDTVANSIDIIDLEAKKFEYFSPSGSGSLMSPINTEISAEDSLYVADARRGQVVIFNSSGKHIDAIGKKGELKPTDVAIRGNKIFICDLKSHSVLVYDKETKELLYSIPKDKESEEAKLFSPTNIDIADSGNVYVTDTGGFNVKKFDNEGNFLQTFGYLGKAPGQFARPKGVAVDREERVYAVDNAFANVQIFNTEGELLMYFPEIGDAAELSLPTGIYIDYDHIEYFREFIDESFNVEYLVFVISQYGERKISIFGYGSKI